MEKSTNKTRLLALMELLKKHTDEENELTLENLIELFYENYKEEIGKTALLNDIKTLERSKLFDITINQEKNGLPKFYSHQFRLFEIHELRLLMDAVVSAKFITKEQTYLLLNKIKKLTSVHQAIKLENQVQVNSDLKSQNSNIKFHIHNIHLAIANCLEIKFKYGRYDIKKEFQLSNKGNYYTIQPYGLVWNNDYYYLIGKNEEKLLHYRLDRITELIITENEFKKDSSFDLNTYTKQLFLMYSGKEEWVEIYFDNHLINVIIDKFGPKVSIKPIDEHTFSLKTKAAISKGFIRWILTWGSDAKVIEPAFLVEQVKDEIRKVHNQYS
ncbi:helix-turn-helix transcriptional regulator [Microbacteriaceae bacterium 4G12]